MSITTDTKKKSKVKITFNGESVGYILVEWIGLVESVLCDGHHMDSGEDYHKELFTIDSATIIHEHIEKGDPEFRNVTQMTFEIKDGFFTYYARDESGNMVKSFMTSLSYIHTIQTMKDEPKFSDSKINHLDTSEKKSLK